MFEFFAIASAIFGGASVIQGQKAAKSARRARASEAQRTNLMAARERRQAIRDQRLAFATAENNAALGGVSDSSGAQGGQGSIISQGNANLSFLDQQLALTNQANKWLDKSAQQATSADMWQGFSKLAASGANFFGGAPAGPTANIPQIPAPPSPANNFHLFPAQ